MGNKRIVVMGNNDHKGGLIVHYEYLVNFLVNNGYEVVCLNINDNDNSFSKENLISQIRIPYKPKTSWDKLIKLIRIIYCGFQVRLFKPSLFIATGLGGSYTTIASFLGHKTFKIHQEVIFDAKLDEHRIKVNKRFDAIAVQTKTMIENYKNNVKKDAIVNYLPCFTRKMNPAEVLPINASKSLIKLVYFGRLAHNKGLVNFINNTKNIFNQENIILDIYGKGQEYQNIKDIIENNALNNKIFLKGFFTDENFPNLIVSYDAVILPSTYNEGLPLVLIESMYYNKPIFASKMGAIPELAAINRGIFLADFNENQHKNLGEFIERIKKGDYNDTKIKEIYDLNFSNKCFENTWTEMLKNPKKYFN